MLTMLLVKNYYEEFFYLFLLIRVK